MKICVAQTIPFKGDIDRNIGQHIKLIQSAISQKADLIVFPELSITGYEPELAKELATDQDDKRFDVFQQISNSKQVTIGVGMPIKSKEGILISMILFQPQQERMIYSKQYLHPDELPFFVPGHGQVFLNVNEQKIAIAICYEIAVSEHMENIIKNNSTIYIASVAKSVEGTRKAIARLSEIAKKYSRVALMANCSGTCDNFICGGKTSAWDNKGKLAGQLSDNKKGILIQDTESEKAFKYYL